LAIGRPGAALLDLGIVDLEELVEPCKKFRTRLAHDYEENRRRRGSSFWVSVCVS
jgi:hypothetical protein